jgi:AraC family transcriptional regulator, transcriptional activator of pobA
MSITCISTTNSLSGQPGSFTVQQNNLPYAHFEIHALQSVTGQKLLTERSAKKIQHYEVLCITKGDGQVIVDLNTYQFSNGTIYCLFPGQLRSIEPASQLEGYYISASADFIYLSQTFSGLALKSQSFQSPLDPLEVQIDEALGSEINEVLVKLEREYENYFLMRSDILFGLFKIFAIYLTRKYVTTQSVNPHKRYASLVSHFFSLVQKNYKSRKMVIEYADEMCISPSYLNHVIKKNSGFSASYHIQQQIVLEAKRQAKYSDRSMKEIAYDLGFDDVAHFSKYFKNNTGVTFTYFKQFHVR